jgi:hypothetical protein
MDQKASSDFKVKNIWLGKLPSLVDQLIAVN